MNRKKGMAALLMSVTLGGAVLTACSNSNTTSSSEEGGKVEEIVFAMPSFNRIPDDLSKVTDAINAITTGKIGVKVDFRIYGPADYAQKVNLALQSGEKMDVFTTLGQFSNYVSKSQVAPLDDLLAEYGKEMTALLEKDFGADMLKATTIGGRIYGIPVNKGMSLPINFVYNADMLQAAGFTADDVESVEDLPAIFEAVKSANPDVVPFGPINVNPSDTGLINLLKGTYKVDMLTDTTGVGVVVGNDGKVVNLYETDAFKNGVQMMRDWYDKGYLQKDAATTTITSSEMVSSGREFSFLGGYGGLEVGKTISAQTGKNVETKRIAPFYFDTSAVNSVSWMVSSTSKVPEASVKFLNLLYTDEQLINTILYGIEGEDYVKVDEHHVKFPDGKDANTVSYTAMLSTGIVGSESLQYQFEGINWSDIEVKLKENKETERSPYFGFIFDQSDVKTQISAVNNVVNQYLPGLVTGSLDPETTLPKFVKALNDAGAADVIKSKQEQLDQWLAAQGN
ncbi:ABC transporter substrate-binding protein [Cohnella thailandensis]|uniref:ABC transporter substrate-binding protein n=1 Tax=Cohnella thailandensis TaxID=557557 RepID=A0A841SQA3_9BACL|nr:ABC transporter substrate-binding protein [Cohnella thailandensis]MBB6634593.1 ABC transporter substrate-binding protein [Cohnella thailandensis]MBP1972851.1 putative aldouronate transport system substrate-binding protein [Cohnella thailandensis]